MNRWRYEELKDLLKDESLPAMIVDLEIVERNVSRLGEVAKARGKTLRTASKSIRVVELLRHVMQQGGDTFRGLMCFSAREALFLTEQGFDDLLIAYPTVQASDLAAIWEASERGHKIIPMIDEEEHIEVLARFWKERTSANPAVGPLPVCIDVDVSYRPFGGSLHLGVRRSPILGINDFEKLVAMLEATGSLRLVGVMGYEAQIAGLPDNNPFGALLNSPKRLIKKLSVADVYKKREAIANFLERRRIEIDFFNGGGTGSLSTTVHEPWITEVTAGSGFLQSQLFDYYRDNQNEAGFCFALQATRVPDSGVITCQSGGFIASGEVSQDKNPRPFLPEGLKTFPQEGFGEVQTPLKVAKGSMIQPGDPVFFRPAKAGEIAKRFNEYLLKRGSKIEGRAPTYRGMGKAFF